MNRHSPLLSLLKFICTSLVPGLTALTFAVEKSGTLPGNETWSGSIEITNTVTVPEGVTLTIEPGTIIKFSDTRALNIDGTVNAIGTAGSPIYFTSIKDDSIGGDTNGDGATTTPEANNWNGLALQSGGTASLNLQHAQLRYAGRSGYSIQVLSGEASIQNTTIRDGSNTGIRYTSSAAENYVLNNVTLERIGTSSTHYGVNFESTSGTITATNLTLTDIGGSHIRVNRIERWTSSGTTLSGTGLKAIHIEGGTIEDAQSWDDSVPYYLSNGITIETTGSLDIPAGSLIMGDTSGKLTVKGQLTAASATFTAINADTIDGDINGNGAATQPAANDWNGIELTTNGISVDLDDVIIRYAGRQGASLIQRTGVLNLKDSTIEDGQNDGVSVTGGSAYLSGNTVRNVTQYGFELRGTNAFCSLIDNDVQSSTLAPYYFWASMQIESSGNQASGSGRDNAIYVDGTNMQENHDWT